MIENKKTIVEVPLGSTPLGEREEPKSSEKDNLEERSIEGGATDIISQESKSKALTKSRQSALAKYFDKEWWRASKAEKRHGIAVPLEWKNYYGLEKEYLQKLTTEREELSLGTPYERVEKLPPRRSKRDKKGVLSSTKYSRIPVNESQKDTESINKLYTRGSVENGCYQLH